MDFYTVTRQLSKNQIIAQLMKHKLSVYLGRVNTVFKIFAKK